MTTPSIVLPILLAVGGVIVGGLWKLARLVERMEATIAEGQDLYRAIAKSLSSENLHIIGALMEETE